LLEKCVDVSCQMGSVETTNTDMDDSLLHTLSLVCWDGNILHLGQVLGV
jgi:hypothetical protein